MGQISIIKNVDNLQPTMSPDNYFVISADTNTTDKFRYVFDMVIDNQIVYQGKATPNPEGLGIIVVEDVIDNFASNTPIAFSGDSQIFVHETEWFSKPPNGEVIEYAMFFGEEHADANGIITGYTGVGKFQGEPAYPSGAKRAYLGTMGRNIFSNLQEYDTNNLLMDGYDGLFPSQESLFLTNSPRIREVGLNDYFTLSALNYRFDTQVLPNQSYAYDVEYNFYNEANVYITGYTVSNIRANGGGPRTGCTDTFSSYTLPSGETQSNWNIIHIGAGPQNIWIPDDTAYYTVQLLGLIEVPPTPSVTPSAGITPTPTVTPSITPTPSPSGLPIGYTKWLFQSCCSGGPQAVFAVQSGTTGTVRVYNDQCYYALEPSSADYDAIISGSAPFSSCVSCTAAYECRGGTGPAEASPGRSSGTPKRAPSQSDIPDNTGCPTWEPVSELFTFNVQCQYDAFNSRQFIFKNRFGTWDYFRFNYKKTEQIEIDRTQYKKFSINYGSSNPIKTTYGRGLTDYSTQIREVHTVNTGFINEPDMYYLEELYTSNDVYVILDNGNVFPVNIVSTSFEKKTAGRGKEITNLTLQYEFANNIRLLNQ
jgi:hypothetical protein